MIILNNKKDEGNKSEETTLLGDRKSSLFKQKKSD
jgi:hypothetical protein